MPAPVHKLLRKIGADDVEFFDAETGQTVDKSRMTPEQIEAAVKWAAAYIKTQGTVH